ncbi:MAG: hypothetical protein RIS54_1454 [Verrucomicrobiota bacterium]|jgi:hypothetical protein
MKTKDFSIVALAPLVVLAVPFVGNFVSAEVNWTASDFALMWALLAAATFAWRLLATRPGANLPYQLGAALAVGTGLMLMWVTLAVAVIGHGNPANLLYPGVILLGLTGVGVTRFQPQGLARTAFVVAFATFLVPLIGLMVQPDDFSPGVMQVFTLNFGFVLMFTLAGLLFRQAAEKQTAVAR